MTLINALVVLAVLLVVTVAIGAYLQWRQRTPQHHLPHEVVDAQRLGADGLGETATLLQFSTEICARCPGVHRQLAAVAAAHDGVRHLDVDLTHRPDLARHFHVMQTPTTLILDRHGVIRTRFGGVPNPDVIELELAGLDGSRSDV